jgi:ClpP class serine protease
MALAPHDGAAQVLLDAAARQRQVGDSEEGKRTMDFTTLIWLFFIFAALTPALQRRYQEACRRFVIQRFEKKRRSRVITLIHRQETMSFLGIPFSRYLDVDDSEQILRAVRLTPEDMPLDLILHTPGGLVLAAEQIAQALVRHKAKVTVFVPHYAMSGGTLLALAADEIVMDRNAVLGPVDPQVGEYPAVSILKVLERKDINEIDDETVILADMAGKAMEQVRDTVREILEGNAMPEAEARRLAETLASGRWTHDYPISLEEIQKLGLPAHDDMPNEVYALMDLYPQAGGRRPSVQYIPTPYQPPERKEGGKGERG